MLCRYRRRWRASAAGASVLATLLTLLPVARGQTFTTLFSFDGAAHGAGPASGLTLSANGSTLYGTTYSGGAGNYGTVFSEPVTGGTPNVLFSCNSSYGENPQDGALTLSADGSTLYGTTTLGGAGSDGTVFSEPVTGGTPTVLFSANSTTGANPKGSVTLINSTLYGVGKGGGANSDGTIFSVPVTGGGTSNVSVLCNFDGTHGATPTTGSFVVSGLTFYGTTALGGAGSKGTVFSMPVAGVAGGAPTVLDSFTGQPDGYEPMENLVLSGSTLYGVTELGGANNDGTVFSIPLSGGTPTIMYSFTGGNDGNLPLGGLTLHGPYLFGTTYSGGADGDGTIFSIPVNGTAVTTMYTFTSGAANSALVLGGDTLYGVTTNGGANGEGTVFALSGIFQPGDANGDGQVDVNDLTIVLSHFGDSGCSWTQGCMDGDPTGKVDVNDLTIVLSTFGTTYAASLGTKAVPEPATVLLAAAGLAGWLACLCWKRK